MAHPCRIKNVTVVSVNWQVFSLELFDKSVCSCMENIVSAPEKSTDVNPNDSFGQTRLWMMASIQNSKKQAGPYFTHNRS